MASTEFLAKAYLAYFGRPVDPVGAFAFKDSTEQEVYEAFFASPESQALYGTDFGADQINAIYQMLFNRDAEPAGLAFWLNEIQLGHLTPAGAALGIMNGALNQDAVAVNNKLVASAQFTASLDTLAETEAYVGNGAAAVAREFLQTITTFPATEAQVQGVIDTLVEMQGAPVNGPAGVFTLEETYATVTHEAYTHEELYWGYNPHPHSETGGVDNMAGGNTNNLTNEGPEDGGIPVEYLIDFIEDLVGMDFVQLGLINVASGTDDGMNNGEASPNDDPVEDDSTSAANNIVSIDLSNNSGSGTYTITVTTQDGEVAAAEVQLGEMYFKLLHDALYDAEGNSRLFMKEITTEASTSEELTPIVLTPYNNNGGTVETLPDPLPNANDDLIVAGRLELLHRAYIDAGGGYNTLEVDAKGTYAQPLLIANVQEIQVQNLPNVYTTTGSGDGYLENSTYPQLGNLLPDGTGAEYNSILDLSRAIDIEKLVVTEGWDTGVALGSLTIVGIRNGAEARFEGAFSQDVTLHYGQGLTGSLNVELAIGDVTADINILHNASVLNIDSQGVENHMHVFFAGGSLSRMNVSGTGVFGVDENLASSFNQGRPVIIDASANTGGLDITLDNSGSGTTYTHYNVKVTGTAADDEIAVRNISTDAADGVVVIAAGNGNNTIDTNYSNIVDITSGSGNDKITSMSSESVTIVAGDGTNVITTDGSKVVDITTGSGKDTISAQSGEDVTIDAGDGNNSINTSFSEVVSITTGAGNDSITSVNSGTVSVEAGDGNNTIKVQAAEISITTGTGTDKVTISGTDTEFDLGDNSGDWNDDNYGVNSHFSDDVAPGALLTIDMGSGSNTLYLGWDIDLNGDGDFVDNNESAVGVTALEGSSISGSTIKLYVENNSDLTQADLSNAGITSVVLKQELRITAEQFADIGAQAFSVFRDEEGATEDLYIVVSEDTTLSTLVDLGDLSANVRLHFELHNGATLTLSAEELHNHVAWHGIDSTDGLNGKVHITNAGMNFNPFDNGPDHQVIDGGSLSDSFAGSTDVTIDRRLDGFNRPGEDTNVDVTLIDTTGAATLVISNDIVLGDTGNPTTLKIIGNQDIDFQAVVDLGDDIPANPGMGDSIDFSELDGQVSGLTVLNFSEIDWVSGNNTGTRINVGLSGNVGSEEQGLVSSGVETYVVTSIVDNDNDDDGLNPNEDTATFYLCDETEDVQVIGLQGNAGKTLTFANVPWGRVHPSILLEGDGYADWNEAPKADGSPETSDIGTVIVEYFTAGAPAVVNINNGGTELGVNSTGGERKFVVEGIQLVNAKSLALNVTEGDADISMLMADSGLESMTVTATEDVTVNGDLPTTLTSIDASGVAGAFTASVDPDADFSFDGAAGGSTLTISGDFTATAATSIDGGAAGMTLVIGEDTEVVLNDAVLANINAVELEDDAELELTIDQVADIGAANIGLAAGADNATLNLYGLDSNPFALSMFPDFDDGLTIGVLTVADLPVVTLDPTTDLSGIAALNVHAGTVLNLTAAQFQQLTGAGTIVGIGGTTDFTVNITGLTQADVEDGLDLTGVVADTTTITMAGDVELVDTDDLGTFSVVMGDDMTLTLADIQQADGLDISGGSNTTLAFTDQAAAVPSIDASGFDVDTLMVLNILVDGTNVDLMFDHLPGSVVKEIYNDTGWVDLISQIVNVTAGTTVPGALTFNPITNDTELEFFTLNLMGGTEISGDLGLSTTAKQIAGNDQLRKHLDTLTINSTGTAENLLTGETDNIITGDIDPLASGVGTTDNNLLNVVINASQNLVVEGDVIFSSVVGDDAVTGNDDDEAVATLTVNGTADVTLGELNTSDDDVDGLNVVNNSTGTLSAELNAATLDADDALSFTGDNIVLTITGAVDLSDDVLTGVTQIVLTDGAALTLSQAQLDALGVANLSHADFDDTGDEAFLHIVDLGSDPFDVSALADGIVAQTVTMASGSITLDPATNLTGVLEIRVPEGGTLTLTAAQFQQLQGNGTITSFDTNGNNGDGNEFNVNITDLTQADIDYDVDNGSGETDGFILEGIADGASVNITLAEDVDLAANTNLNHDELESLVVTLANGQTLGLANSTQADGLVVDGGSNTTLVLKFEAMDGVDTSIDASGYDVTVLKALATFVGGENVEDLLLNVDSAIEERYYHDPEELGFVSATNRVVVVEKEVTADGYLMYNDPQDDREVRTLHLTMEGGSEIDGDLNLSTIAKDPGLVTQFFSKLTIVSEGTAADENYTTGETANIIDGDIHAEGTDVSATVVEVENNLLDVEIQATQVLEITGDIVFNSVDADDYPDAELSVSGTADVTIQQLDVTDAEIDTLAIANTGTGTLTVTGASPAINGAGGAIETITFTGSGDMVFGDHDDTTTNTGLSASTLSTLDASGMSGDLDLGEVENVDNAAFTFTAGSGVTMMTFTDAGLDSDGLDNIAGNADDTAGWTFDFSDAAAGSEFHLYDPAGTNGSKLNIDLGANTTLYIDESMDLSNLDLTITQVQDIVLADGAVLVLTAAQANGLNIVAGADTGAAGITAVVNIVDLGGDAVDLSGVAANIAGTITLEDNDVTVNAASNLGEFSVTLTELADTSASLAGQTIRFQTVAQAEREIIVDEAVGNNNDSSTNVVWLFTSIANVNGVDTSDYDGAIGRLWFTEELVNNEGGLVESLFTTLPSTILRVDFADAATLDIELSSNAVDRIMEFVNFSSVGDLTFSDVGLNPEEHVRNLTLMLGGEATIGDVDLDDVVADPDVDTDTVDFQVLTIQSHRALHEDHILASEEYLQDNDGVAELRDGIDADLDLDDPENVLPANMNTVGDIGVGTQHSVNLMDVFIDTLDVSVEDDGSEGEGAALTVGTITFENGNATAAANNADVNALLDITGDNNITIAAINTADADITGFTLDATGFTAVLDPVMHMDNTETFTIINTNAAGADAAANMIFTEVEGNELSAIDVSGYDGDITITLSQIDSNDDDSTPDTPANDGVLDAFTYTAGAGDNDVIVAAVGGNVPTLEAGSEWNFVFTGSDADSTLTLDESVNLAAGAILNLTDANLIITGDLDLSDVVLNIVGGSINVGAGQSLTISVAQALALPVDIEGEGTVYITGNADDVDGAALGLHLKTVGVNVAGVVLTIADGVDPAAGDEVLGLTLTGGVDDNGDPIGQNVVGSPNDDAIVTADDLDNTLNGMGGDDTLEGGDDLVDAPDNFNTYVVASGTDTITGLKSGSDVDDIADVITASGGATVQATVADDFYATAGTTNTGATVEITATDTVAGTDNIIDMTEAGGTSGYTITGSNFQTGGVDDDGNDTLIGSEQADIINGGNWLQEDAAQVDVLTGNGGSDRFVFNTSVSSAATLTIATTTAGVDREVITFTTDDTDEGTETITVSYTINGIAGAAVIDLTGVDVTSVAAVTSAAIAAIDAKAGISATAGAGAGEVVVSGDNSGSVTITGYAVADGDGNDWADPTDADGTDIAQVSTITVSGTPTDGDLYSVVVDYLDGTGTSDDYTAGAPDPLTSDAVAAGLDDLLSEAVVTAVAAGSVITFTDVDDDDGGFTLLADTTAAFAGSGASDNGADNYLTADVITDFTSGEDSITFGLAAGQSGSNYFEAAAVANYATALANADAAFDSTVQYYLTSATDLDGTGGTGQVEGEEGAGLLFVDANLDGNADLVVLLLGVTSANFSALDIVA